MLDYRGNIYAVRIFDYIQFILNIHHIGDSSKVKGILGNGNRIAREHIVLH